MTTEPAASAMPTPADVRVLTADERAHRPEAHVGREHEELDCDELLRSGLRSLGHLAGASEAPDDDQTREALDDRVEPEPDERD